MNSMNVSKYGLNSIKFVVVPGILIPFHKVCITQEYVKHINTIKYKFSVNMNLMYPKQQFIVMIFLFYK